MGIIVITWVIAGLLVAGYIWFMVWRIRVDRRKKAEKTGALTAEATTAAKLERILQKDVWPPTEVEAPAPQVASSGASDDAAPEVEPAVAAAMAATPPAPPASSSDRAVLDVTTSLAGIRLPNDLVPLTTMAARPGIDDRVAFWTDVATADDVGRDFAGELERLGYTVKWVEMRMLTAEREANRLIAVVHPDANKAIIDDKQAFSSVPENTVVVEVWSQPY